MELGCSDRFGDNNHDLPKPNVLDENSGFAASLSRDYNSASYHLGII